LLGSTSVDACVEHKIVLTNLRGVCQSYTFNKHDIHVSFYIQAQLLCSYSFLGPYKQKKIPKKKSKEKILKTKIMTEEKQK